MNERVVHVPLGERAYDIVIAAGAIDRVGELIAERRRPSRVLVVCDENVRDLWAETLAGALAPVTPEGEQSIFLAVEPGEESKCVEIVDSLWMHLLEAGADRRTIVAALGGGVVGDLAGFAAAGFARGIDFVQVPTSLLAMVDSSVGGKVGVNLPGAKNMVGAFWQPVLVVIDPEVLTTLPEREFAAGMAEVVKYGVIQDAELFARLEAEREAIADKDQSTLSEVIARCCELKAEVVVEDERETTGRRAILNYGHTFAHAFEAGCGYGELLHGEAVSIGMLCASRLAASRGLIDEELTERQSRLLEAFDLPIVVPDVDGERLLELMQHDKKTEHGRLRFVLPVRLGEVRVFDDVTREEVVAALDGGRA